MVFTTNPDVLHEIIDEMLERQHGDVVTLSLVSKELRNITAPLLFSHVQNRRWDAELKRLSIGEMWPMSLWKYIIRVDVYDHPNPTRGVIDFAPLASALSQIPLLRHVCFELDAVPPRLLLSSLTSAHNLDTLEFRNARFDGPSVAHYFAAMKLESLTIAIGLTRDKAVNFPEEKGNVAEILAVLAERLLHLEISGDLVSFETMKNHNWPNLLTLRYTDHVPSGKLLPLYSVISRMPRLRNLGYNFAAAAQWYRSAFVFCKGQPQSLQLSATHPDLESLTVSNIFTEDVILDHLPAGLKVLRVLALRDDLRVGQHELMSYYPYFPISGGDAFRIVRSASGLRNLVELAITLDTCPSPSLIEAVAVSCPGLHILELTHGRYELNIDDSPYTIESLARPLMSLKFLHDLRLTIWFGVQSDGFGSHSTKYEVYRRIGAAAQVFASMLPKLATISFSFTNFRRYDQTSHPLTWYHLAVHDGVDGRSPVAKFDGYREYYSHDRPASRRFCQ
ncbi:hypothetical protein Hypma_008229 [Hypsizygus marmoreus]|uniref:F-box domain-containing protein n=1 Tax=Hypsizygus marmoreus TaxID=39966 RepID=A0A369JTW6_HYPMA|nr:hypothetical protein Hypma_008229 [Hypsizygus marmoreus]